MSICADGKCSNMCNGHNVTVCVTQGQIDGRTGAGRRGED